MVFVTFWPGARFVKFASPTSSIPESAMIVEFSETVPRFITVMVMSIVDPTVVDPGVAVTEYTSRLWGEVVVVTTIVIEAERVMIKGVYVAETTRVHISVGVAAFVLMVMGSMTVGFVWFKSARLKLKPAEGGEGQLLVNIALIPVSWPVNDSFEISDTLMLVEFPTEIVNMFTAGTTAKSGPRTWTENVTVWVMRPLYAGTATV
jgi:hypothetical protein